MVFGFAKRQFPQNSAARRTLIEIKSEIGFFGAFLEPRPDNEC